MQAKIRLNKEMRQNLQYIGETVGIFKGKKAHEVFETPQIDTLPYLQIESLRNEGKKMYARAPNGVIATKDDVIIAWDGANSGTVGFNLAGYIGSTLAVLRPKSKNIYSSFLGYFLQGKFRYIQEHCTGATIPHVNRNILEKLQIPLLPLEEQKRIAAICTKADRLRRTRRYAIELSDTYLRSAFLEMFGDPVTNPKGWKIKPIRGIAAKFSDGPFGSNLKTAHYQLSGIRVIRLQNIGVGQLIDDDKAFVSEAHFAGLTKHSCLSGDVIVGTMGEPNLRACILPKSIPIALNKADCVQIRPDPKQATSQYICWLLNMPHTLHLALGLIHGQTRERINMGSLAEIYVPIPPLPLQEKFAQIVQKSDRIRAQQREALRQAEHLFQTILHRAFRGEL